MVVVGCGVVVGAWVVVVVACLVVVLAGGWGVGAAVVPGTTIPEEESW